MVRGSRGSACYHGNRGNSTKTKYTFSPPSLSDVFLDLLTKSTLEEMEKLRRTDSAINNRGEANNGEANDGAQLGPGSAFSSYILMEDLIDKMKLLNYDTEFVREFNIKPLPR